MDSKTCWELFLETGAPEAYLAFLDLRRTEENHVSDGSGPGAPADRIQGP